jgi:ribose 5-phosphate isomerase A
MTQIDLKKALAEKAISLVKDNSVVGLGASSAMKHLIECVSWEIKKGLKIKLVTSSFVTHQLIVEEGLEVYPLSYFSSIDIYFDGCDQFDEDLNALKSGGGIHTREKLAASMAREFVIIGDDSKYTTKFNEKYPLVLEVLPEAYQYVMAKMYSLFPGSRTEIRLSDKKIGAAITDNGNYLTDTWFTHWPAPKLVEELTREITGVVETSLFYQIAGKAIVTGEKGVSIIEKRFYE